MTENTQAKKTVLLVEDDADVLFQERTVLEAAGYNIIEATSRREAEEILQTTSPDIAIVDLMLEEMDAGFVLCHHIKMQETPIPVILATGVKQETGMDFDAATREERSWVKADAFLDKPIRPEQLLYEVECLLQE